MDGILGKKRSVVLPPPSSQGPAHWGQQRAWGPNRPSAPLPLATVGTARCPPVSPGCHVPKLAPQIGLSCQVIWHSGLLWGSLVYSGIVAGHTCSRR